MLFWIILAVFVVFTVLAIIANRRCWDGEGWLFAIAVVFGIVVLVMGFIVFDAYVSQDAYKAEILAEYESLTYQLENDLYSGDDDLVGKKDLFADIQKYNEDVAGSQAAARNFWVNVFYSPFYRLNESEGGVPLIDYERILSSQN